MRRYDAAAEMAESALSLEPNHTMAMFHLINARIQQGRTKEAIEVAQHATQLFSEWLVPLAYLALAYSQAGRLDDARRTLEQMHTLAQHGYAHATPLAGGHLYMGDLDGCFEWL